MKTLLYPVLGLSVLATAAVGQRMSNPNAPTIGQFIEIPEQGRLELSYASIRWGSGGWADALKNEETRGQMRTMINQAAADQPLGSLKTSFAVMVGGQRVPAGDYSLAFTLDDGFKWQITLSNDSDRVTVPLAIRPSMAPRKRLTLSLMAGDEDLTGDMLVAFGNQICQLPLAVATAEPEQVATPKGILNTRCPLMDDPVDKDYVVTYKNYNIGFCCDVCFEDWEDLSAAEKDGILRELIGGAPEQEEEQNVELTVLNNRFCPLMDEPVEEGYFVVYKQVQFNMCCEDCTLEWAKFTTAEKDEVLATIWQ